MGNKKSTSFQGLGITSETTLLLSALILVPVSLHKSKP